ncbi:MAG: 2-oxoacid:acceptor oxidoreductase subunit alpha [Armatimonadetes bacterium]|nr:2-oxoacid:acceptor oxidoreductase subunit alpha [Armatimonadota bacterium]MDW8122987.1 2-oxoacid:acceptor oxidoreductase subunit alpha [Armatimonadota bacterium]
MVKNNCTIKLGGEAGQGVESSGMGFAKAIARAGLYIFGVQDYMSRIRGGHNWYQIRVHTRPLYAHETSVHLLLAFDERTVHDHSAELVKGGGVLYDDGLKVDQSSLSAMDLIPMPMPLLKIAEEVGGNKLMMNTAAVAAAAGICEFDLSYVEQVIRDNFGRRKGSEIADRNIRVANHAYEEARKRYAHLFEWKLEPIPGAPRRMVINGNQALGLGTLAAGCKMVSGYPMTPASTLLEFLAGQARKFGLVVRQTEDEISGILHCIGAAHAGVRAMSCTSGGGFSLMVESLSLAGSTETPVVIVLAQRPGPATGLPTRTGQEDLLFALHAGHGEFPRAVLAPGTIEQCFYHMARAFNIAEKYQMPVIVMTDNFLANSIRSVEKEAFDFAAIARSIDRGALILPHEEDKVTQATAEGYRRYELTENGISLRIPPGHPNAVYSVAGEEHTPEGFIDWEETAHNRNLMMNKRMKKLTLCAEEDMGVYEFYGPEDAETTLLCWGSSYGPVREAVDVLNSNGMRVNMLHFVDIHPLHWDAVGEVLDRCHTVVAVEGNFSAQFSRWLTMNTGRRPDAKITRFDGRPLNPDFIAAELHKALIRV